MNTKRRRSWATDAHSFVATFDKNIARRTSALGRFLVLFTVLAWAFYMYEQVGRLRRIDSGVGDVVEVSLSIILVSALTASALAYLIARLGYFTRVGAHRRTPLSVIHDDLDLDQPTVTVLVPSYREDIRVIRQTLLSIALQEYARVRVVLLIDDPPDSNDPAEEQLLQQARNVPSEIVELLEPQRRIYQQALDQFDDSYVEPGPASVKALQDLSEHYENAATWLRMLAVDVCNDPEADHTEDFLAGNVIERLASDFSSTSSALQRAATTDSARVSRHRARQLHRRLVWVFEADVWSFERKQFASLSHEPNKAMNLNSYLGLMGKRYSIETSPGARVLVERHGIETGLDIPDSDYVVTVDADSVLLPEYCLRLVHLMEQPENQRVAVMQTPYSAYPGAKSALERIAGATTDVQHIVHQGLVQFGATFWVGANAVLRKTAIDELRTDSMEDGFSIARYIADRTVIEDTESSIQLRRSGWQLYNYPERLSYSATPPDFGSLVVQRKRWANGGLLILGQWLKLARHRTKGRNGSGAARVTRTELFLRFSYLASISWVSIGLTILLLFPFDQRLLSRVAVATALPYFFATASDLRRCGYKRRDVVGVYALNLILLPVNLAGTVSSIFQAVGGQRIEFARTPKVKDRTATPLLFVLTPVMLLIWSSYSFARDIDANAFVRAAFTGTNVIALSFALLFYLGPIAALVDVAAGIRESMRVPVKTKIAVPPNVPEWASVLYIGDVDEQDAEEVAPLALALSARDQLLTYPGGVKQGPIALGSAGGSIGEPMIDLREVTVMVPAPEGAE